MADFKYADALERFDAALALGGDPALYHNSGRALEMLGRYPEALERLRSFRSRATPELLAKVPNLNDLIADVERHTCLLTVTVNRPGATVRLEDVVVRKSPLDGVRVNSQKGARLVVALEGHDDDARLLDLPQGGRVSLAVELFPKDRSALLRVTSPVLGATVAVDGLSRGQAPTEARVLAGPHRIDVSAPGHDEAQRQVDLKAGEVRSLSVDLSSSGVHKRWWFWTLVGTAVAAGAGVGVWYAVTTEGPADFGTIEPGQSEVLGHRPPAGGVTIAPVPLVDLRF
jgi:hypothetical protein